MSISSKREVRECAKRVLQPFLDDGHIEIEELKELTKESSDAITVLPVLATEVEKGVLQALKKALQQHTTAESTVLSAIEVQIADLVTASREESGTAASSPNMSAPSSVAASSAAGAPESKPSSSFTLSAFKARMAERRQALKAERDAVERTTSPPSSDATTTATVVATIVTGPPPSLDPTHAIPVGAEQTSESRAASATPSPSLGPSSSGTAAAVVPPLSMGPADDSARDRHDAPPLKQRREEVLVLTAAPLPVEDLYANIIPAMPERAGTRGRGRGFGLRGSVPYHSSPSSGLYNRHPEANRYRQHSNRGGYAGPYSNSAPQYPPFSGDRGRAGRPY